MLLINCKRSLFVCSTLQQVRRRRYKDGFEDRVHIKMYTKHSELGNTGEKAMEWKVSPFSVEKTGSDRQWGTKHLMAISSAFSISTQYRAILYFFPVNQS